ncbi:MAG: tetratricopeptide repeat protein [Calditrichaeota bacterium]|nr:MAG: tetratricopeptide repeat protein [Calditrichota bacterium]
MKLKLIFILSILFFQNLFAQDSTEIKIMELSRQGLHEMSLDDFEKAKETFAKIIEIDSTSPNGYLFLATVYHNLMADFRSLKFMNEFYANIDKAILMAQKRIDNSKDLARSYQYLGASYGFKGLRDASLNNFLSAFSNGLNGLNALEDALEINSEIYDSYYGIGVYHYWRAKKAGLFKYLIFFGDSREQGIEEIKLTRDKGELCGAVSAEALIRIYQAEKDYKNFFKIVDEVLLKYPKDIYARWYLAETYIILGNWEKALETYKEVEKLIYKNGKDYYGVEAEIEIWYYFALCHKNLGNPKLAKEFAEKVVAIPKIKYDKRIFQKDFVSLSKEILLGLKM